MITAKLADALQLELLLKGCEFTPLVLASTHPSALAKEVQPADQVKGLGDLLTMYHTRGGRLAARLQCCS